MADKYERWTRGVKKTVCEELAAEMGRDCNVRMTYEQVQTKWKNLVAKYKKTKDANGKSGNQRVNWEHYDALDQILAKSPDVTPVAPISSDELPIEPIPQCSYTNETPSSSRQSRGPRPDSSMGLKRRKIEGLEKLVALQEKMFSEQKRLTDAFVEYLEKEKEKANM